MNRTSSHQWRIWLCALAALALIAAACSDSDDGSAGSGVSGSLDEEATGSETSDPDDATDPGDDSTGEGPDTGGDSDDYGGRTPSGGEIVLAVEQWPECLNPLTSCASSAWTVWSVFVHVQPPLLEYDINNNLVASPLVLEMPSLDNGGLIRNDDGSFSVTYRLDPDARWSDGEPITSRDVWFTWQAVLNTTGVVGTIGYELITDIDHSDPGTAVISFSETYAPWRELFGAVLPEHAFGGETDLAQHWNDEITVSGGPWLLESWGPEQSILVPNDNYWAPERRPLVDRVVMVPREDTDTEIVSLQTREVDAAFPQPSPGIKERLTPPLAFVSGPSNFIEGLWLNQDAPDRQFDITKNVRQALAYSLDRDRIADVALSPVSDNPIVLQCLGWSPGFGDWCGDEFAHYQQDMAAVEELLTAEGWTRPDPDGLWVNSEGVELILEWNTVAGNKRREDVQALVSEMTRPFGIGWDIINYDPGEFFQNRIPQLNTGPVALYASSTTPDPSVSSRYDIDGIPTAENSYSGNNVIAYRSQEASDLGFAIDSELDDAARLELVRELGALLAEDVPWIPLYVLPNVLSWNTEVLDGPGGYVGHVYGGFYDMYDWSVIG